MGKNEAACPKSEKASSPVQEAPTVHAFPDWATMQAYYGPGVAFTPPYFSAAHAPHPYMWCPQPLMSPFGAPCAAIYPHGFNSHPSMPMGPYSHCQGIPLSTTVEAAIMATPFSVETPAKSSSSKDKSLLKKLKGSDGLAVSVENGNADNITGGSSDISRSDESGGQGSTDESNGNNDIKESKNQGKNSENMTLSEVKAAVAPVTPPAAAMIRGRAGVPHEPWLQDERELKRERRKQSNRESARRSRLRKQTETEELALKVDTLSAENTQLRSEINRLIESSEKLKQENAALMEKMQNAEGNSSEALPSENVDPDGIASVATENLLSKMNKSIDTTSSPRGSSNRKLQQLLSSSPKSIAAG